MDQRNIFIVVAVVVVLAAIGYWQGLFGNRVPMAPVAAPPAATGTTTQ